jgi:3-methyl-2-oxobutanoate hydroxymethyltransferase
MKRKLSRFDLQKMKTEGKKAVWVTAYDFITAQLAEQAGMDMLLVGDSLGMCVYGHDGTVPVTMDQSIRHTEAVRRGAPNTFIIGDMPFGSYQCGWQDAVKNAARYFKEAGVDCIKLEGGTKITEVIKAVTDAGMLLIGHIGLTPQSSSSLGGFKAQGRTATDALATIADARAVYEAGAFALLVEAVPPEVTKIIADELPIPVYSIGAGDCDGQLMICADILGIFQAFTPKFVKKYAQIGAEVKSAFEAYVGDVRAGAFPSQEYTYSMLEGELEKLNQLRRQ